MTFLKAPWISAYDQGLAISALVRGYRLTQKRQLLEVLKHASKIFEQEVSEGGVRVPFDSHCLFMELPGGPLPGILDGFMTSLLGLYDLFLETGSPGVRRLFIDGIEGLKCALPTWNYRNKWSWYGAHAYLCPPAYHCLNRLLLEILGRITSEPLLELYADRWRMDQLSSVERLEIYVDFSSRRTLVGSGTERGGNGNKEQLRCSREKKPTNVQTCLASCKFLIIDRLGIGRPET